MSSAFSDTLQFNVADNNNAIASVEQSENITNSNNSNNNELQDNIINNKNNNAIQPSGTDYSNSNPFPSFMTGGGDQQQQSGLSGNNSSSGGSNLVTLFNMAEFPKISPTAITGENNNNNNNNTQQTIVVAPSAEEKDLSPKTVASNVNYKNPVIQFHDSRINAQAFLTVDAFVPTTNNNNETTLQTFCLVPVSKLTPEQVQQQQLSDASSPVSSGSSLGNTANNFSRSDYTNTTGGDGMSISNNSSQQQQQEEDRRRQSIISNNSATSSNSTTTPGRVPAINVGQHMQTARLVSAGIAVPQNQIQSSTTSQPTSGANSINTGVSPVIANNTNNKNAAVVPPTSSIPFPQLPVANHHHAHAHHQHQRQPAAVPTTTTPTAAHHLLAHHPHAHHHHHHNHAPHQHQHQQQHQLVPLPPGLQHHHHHQHHQQQHHHHTMIIPGATNNHVHQQHVPPPQQQQQQQQQMQLVQIQHPGMAPQFVHVPVSATGAQPSVAGAPITTTAASGVGAQQQQQQQLYTQQQQHQVNTMASAQLQQQQQQQQKAPGSSSVPAPTTATAEDDKNAAGIDYRRFKTRLCVSWQNTGSCSWGNMCAFAHGLHEICTPAAGNETVSTRLDALPTPVATTTNAGTTTTI